MRADWRMRGLAYVAIAGLTACGLNSTPVAVDPSDSVEAAAPELIDGNSAANDKSTSTPKPSGRAAEPRTHSGRAPRPRAGVASDRIELLFERNPEEVTKFDGAVALARLNLPNATDAQIAAAAAQLFGVESRELSPTPNRTDVDFVNPADALNLDDVAALLATVPPLPAGDVEAAIANRANALLGQNRLQPNQIVRVPGRPDNNPGVPFPFVPNQPLDVIVQCEQTFVDTNTVSNIAYFFDFRLDGTVLGQFRTDSNDTISVEGTYTYAGDRIEFEAAGTYNLGGQLREIAFTQRTDRVLPRLGLVGYFDGSGTVSDIPFGAPRTPSPATMRCLTVGHRSNQPQPPTRRQRFECPDQPSAAGTFTNVFEFDTSPFIPGSAFRQRELYTGLSGVGEPNLIWRSEFGIYRQDGDRVYIDFTPAPGVEPSFPDFVSTVGQLRGGGTQLVIPDFPATLETCNLRR